MVKKCLVAISFVALLSACDSGGSRVASGVSARAARDRGVRGLHAALDGAPFDLFSTAREGEVLQVARFALPASYSALPVGEQIITVAQAKGGPVLDRLRLTPGDIDRRTIVIYGDRFSVGLRTLLLEDAPDLLPGGASALRVVHALLGAGSITVTFSEAVIADVPALGNASGYIAVPSGVHELGIQGADATEILFQGALTLAPGQAYTMLVTGEIGYLVLAPVYEG